MLNGFSKQDAIEKISSIQRKNSKCSVDHWIHLGYSKEEASILVSKHQTDVSTKNKIALSVKKTKSKRCIEYWLDYHDNNHELANKSLQEFQDNSSKSSLIKKYGDNEGTLKYNQFVSKMQYINSIKYYIDNYGETDGLIRWQKKFSTRTAFSSKIANKFFEELSKEEILHNCKIYSKVTNTFDEYMINENNNVYFYDFVIPDKKICIEFNGAFWHADPTIYKTGDYIHLGKDILVDSIWERDSKKLSAIEKRGYRTLVLWYKSNKDYHTLLQTAITFLKSHI